MQSDQPPTKNGKVGARTGVTQKPKLSSSKELEMVYSGVILNDPGLGAQI